jgi:hypothetical protein
MEHFPTIEEPLIDDHGCERGPGSVFYVWAFLIVLWHHGRLGQVVPVFKNAGQKGAWEAFFRANPEFIPGPPETADPQPVWHVPLRLPDAASGRRARVCHVNSIGG